MFPDRQVLSFHENYDFMIKNKVDIREINDASTYNFIYQKLHDLLNQNNNRTIQIGFDFSSCSRLWISELLRALATVPAKRNFEVDWFYSAASFSEPLRSITPILKSQPLSNFFAGLPGDANTPLTLIIGMGFEFDKALGVSELLEPFRVYAFLPHGDGSIANDNKYSQEINRAYKSFEDVVGEKRVFDFNVYNPLALFAELESVSFGSLRDSRLIIAPFGPKTFTVGALFTALRHWGQLGIWHMTGGFLETPIDRKPNGKIISFRTLFQSLSNEEST